MPGHAARVLYSLGTDVNTPFFRDGPLEKWWGGEGVGKKPQKNSCKEKCQEKNSCKEEGEEKKFMQKEGPIVTFSESLSFRNQQYYQAQYE